jgi:hypothetical protein
MKKIVLAGLFAVSLMAFSQDQASAWVNSRFGVGLNWAWQSGGNNLGWGAWRNGQPPGPESFGSNFMPMQGFPGFGGAPMPTAAPVQNAYDYPAAQPQYPVPYPSPYQFATYPRPIYYYPAPSYYYYGR